jgi:hypothetical protein
MSLIAESVLFAPFKMLGLAFFFIFDDLPDMFQLCDCDF